MPKAGKPRTATVDGVQVVVLSPEQYDGLEANRRRVGGLQTLVARMKQEGLSPWCGDSLASASEC
ncbi:hypothetical protein [Kitasatospora sp. NPDC056184]|uniref:hypothetical protein n=1 Tax=Kitasatospora sp. NPDC056184 TaxID=3345738 RepID=UPI0035E0EEDA